MTEETLAILTWLIPAGPLLVFFLIVLFTNRNKTLSWILAWGGVFLALLLGWIVALNVVTSFIGDPHHLVEHPTVVESSLAWLPIGLFPNWLRIGVSVDALTAIMLIMVTTTITAIFIYSVGYHRWGEGHIEGCCLPRGHRAGGKVFGGERRAVIRDTGYA